ncbi:hypothetical protein O3P69_016401 [Scylla paramamosain]|uniref:Uncharacterized protein n=1 Tax=Scylla paramamosain TaxID=85552 RepID=A0AAW0TG40_SCYPA
MKLRSHESSSRGWDSGTSQRTQGRLTAKSGGLGGWVLLAVWWSCCLRGIRRVTEWCENRHPPRRLLRCTLDLERGHASTQTVTGDDYGHQYDQISASRAQENTKTDALQT